MPPLGRSKANKVKLFLSLTSMHTNSFFFVWLFFFLFFVSFSGVLELLLWEPGLSKRLFHLWSPKPVFYWCFWTTAKGRGRGWGRGRTSSVTCGLPSWYKSPSSHYPKHWLARLLQGPLAYGARSYGSHKALLFMDGCWIFVVEGEAKTKNIVCAAMLASISLISFCYWDNVVIRMLCKELFINVTMCIFLLHFTLFCHGKY